MLNLSSFGRPIQPTPRVFTDLLPPGLPRQPGGAPAAHASLAVKDHLAVFGGAREAEAVLELVFGDEEGIGGGGDGDVDGAWDVTGLNEFAWFAGVCWERKKRSWLARCGWEGWMGREAGFYR